MDRLIDLLPMLLAGLLLYKCSIVKPAGALREDHLSSRSCLSARGFFAVTVIMHHIAQHTSAGLLFHRFEYLGNMPVSVFFFISGYGLMKRLASDASYGRSILRRRLPKVAVPFFLAAAAYKLMCLCTGQEMSAGDMLGYLINSGNSLCILWYFVVIAGAYFLFAVSALLFGGKPKAVLISMVLCWVVYVIAGSCAGLGEWWYNTAHLLPIGMAWALYEGGIQRTVKKCWLPVTVLCAAGFALIFTQYDSIYALCPTAAFHLALAVLRNMFFTLGFVLITMKLRFGNRALELLGKVSMELYAVQLIPLDLFHSEAIWIGSDLMYALAVLFTTVTVSVLIYVVKKKLKKQPSLG